MPTKKKKAIGKPTKKTKAVTVKVRKTKKGNTRVSISGISLSKLQTELKHQGALQTALDKHKGLLSEKGLNVKEKGQIRRDIAHLRNNISASKKHVSILKRSI